MTRWLEKLLRLILWGLTFGAALAVTVFATQANYLGCRAALELLRYEEMPAALDLLLGPIVGPFLGSANQIHCLALLIVLIESLGFFWLAHLVFGEVAELLRERVQNRVREDSTESGLIRWEISERLVWIVCLGAVLVPIAWWDIELFRYRAVAGALGIDDPAQAPLLITGWSEQMEERGHLWAWRLAGLGGVGYLALTIAGCLGLELSRSRAIVCLMNVVSPIERLVRGWFGTSELSTADDVAVEDIEGPGAAHIDQEIEDQTDLAEPEGDGAMRMQERDDQSITTPVTSAPGSSTGDAPEEALGHTAPPTPMPATESQSPPQRSARFEPVRTAGASAQPDLRDVIGGSGARVSLAEARRDRNRFYVDETTHQIWDRACWESLIAEPAGNGNGKEPSR